MNYKILGVAFFSTAVGGLYLYYNHYKNKDFDEEEEEDVLDFFENNYLTEFEKLEEKKLEGDNHLSEDMIYTDISFVDLESPNGKIVMYYDTSLNHYKYYIDNKTIPYKYLETVSRKFCIDFDCKSNYIDLFKEIDLSKQKILEEQLKDSSLNNTGVKGGGSMGGIFAKLKTYKTNTKKVVVPEKTNNYKHMGKYNDFYDIKKKEEIVVKPLSYKDYLCSPEEPLSKNNILKNNKELEDIEKMIDSVINSGPKISLSNISSLDDSDIDFDGDGDVDGDVDVDGDGVGVANEVTDKSTIQSEDTNGSSIFDSIKKTFYSSDVDNSEDLCDSEIINHDMADE